MHWIYLIHEFHILSWIIEINELFHNILIYWDALVCNLFSLTKCKSDNMQKESEYHNRYFILMRILQLYLNSILQTWDLLIYFLELQRLMYRGQTETNLYNSISLALCLWGFGINLHICRVVSWSLICLLYWFISPHSLMSRMFQQLRHTEYCLL